MTTVRKIVLLVAMALSAMALAATTASAQETEVEIIDEPTGVPCNPCVVHIRGESRILAVPPGIVVSTCTDEFNARLYHGGTGEIEWDGEPHPSPGCNTTNCLGNPGFNPHWNVNRIGELGNGVEHTNVNFCLRAGANEIPCTGEVLIQEHLPVGSHDYEFRTRPEGIPCAAGTRVIHGMWETEHEGGTSDQEVELIHHVN